MSKDLFDRLIECEGGAVDDPLDHGGPTKWGITRLTFERFCGRLVTQDEFNGLTKDQAKDIYKQMYFVAPHIDQLPVMIQDVMLDCAVMSGPKIAVQALQESLNIPVDYLIGPITIAATFKANQILLLISLVRWRALMLTRIVKRDPSQLKFLSGWMSRVLSFLPLCEAYYE